MTFRIQVAKTASKTPWTWKSVALPLIAVLALQPFGADGAHAAGAQDSPAAQDFEREASLASDAAALIALSERAEASGDFDHAMWLAKLALDRADDRQSKAARTRWLALRGNAAAPSIDVTTILTESANALLEVAKSCERRKLFANAADVLSQLEGTTAQKLADDRLAAILKRKDGFKLLLESGVPVVAAQKRPFSAKELRKLDARHSEWENAYVYDSENYRIRTNMGVEMAHAMGDAMDQVNRFYRKVFQHKERGSMPRCEIRVYKTREEFDIHETDEQSLLGFYSPGENMVTTYDHATQEGFNREELWTTLFHEASHQFTAAVWALLIPTWLNEGTASYFEGALLQPGGIIETNRIPAGRLEELMLYIGPAPGAGSTRSGTDSWTPPDGAPTLKEVVSYMAPGSYPGEYYPFGWGLVYFCRNYEDSASRRVYLPIYEDFMRSYTKGAGERHPFKRFEQYFVTDAKGLGVATFEEFEKRFIDWTRALAKIQFGGPEQAEVLLQRGQKQLQDNMPEAALESFQWAVEKNAAHVTAWLGLCAAARAVKADDRAMYAVRRVAALAARRPDPSAALPHFDGTAEASIATAMATVRELDPVLERILRERLGAVVTTTLEAVDMYVAAGLPCTAASLVREVDRLLDGDGRLRARIRTLRAEHDADGRLARALPVDAELTDWELEGDGWSGTASGGIAVAGEDDGRTVRLRELPPKVFRFEVEVENTGATIGLLFAGRELEEQYFWVEPGEFCGIRRYDPSFEAMLRRGSPFETVKEFPGRAPAEGKKQFTLAIEVEHAALRAFVDGSEVGAIELPCETISGQIGLFVAGERGNFPALRLAY